MLLKVSDGDGGWIIIDNVDQVHLLAKWHTVRNHEELNRLGGEDALNFVPKDCFINGAVNVGLLRFERAGNERKALFLNIVYVCNNDGDTVDRYSVTRRTEKR